MLVSVDDYASLHPPQAALRLRRPITPRQGISYPRPQSSPAPLRSHARFGRRLRLASSATGGASAPSPWTPGPRWGRRRKRSLFPRVRPMSPGEFLGVTKAKKTAGRKLAFSQRFLSLFRRCFAPSRQRKALAAQERLLALKFLLSSSSFYGDNAGFSGSFDERPPQAD